MKVPIDLTSLEDLGDTGKKAAFRLDEFAAPCCAQLAQRRRA